MRKLFGPLLIATVVVIASSVTPLLNQAKAATPGTAPQGVKPGSAVGLPERAEQVPGQLSNPAQNGLETDERANQVYRGEYGPVDQAKPLDFSDQPKSVPRKYAGGQLYNVQVLKGYTYVQLIGQMTYYTTALGVQCTYCHNVGNFAYDTSTKRIARTMQIMSNRAQRDWVEPVKHDYPNYAVTGAVGCVTCHRGAPHMGVKYNIVPVQYPNYTTNTTKQAAYVANSM